MKAIGKLVLGALMLAGATAAIAPAAEAAPYGTDMDMDPAMDAGRAFRLRRGSGLDRRALGPRLARPALRLVVDGRQFLVPLSASGLSLSRPMAPPVWRGYDGYDRAEKTGLRAGLHPWPRRQSSAARVLVFLPEPGGLLPLRPGLRRLAAGAVARRQPLRAIIPNTRTTISGVSNKEWSSDA